LTAQDEHQHGACTHVEGTDPAPGCERVQAREQVEFDVSALALRIGQRERRKQCAEEAGQLIARADRVSDQPAGHIHAGKQHQGDEQQARHHHPGRTELFLNTDQRIQHETAFE